MEGDDGDVAPLPPYDRQWRHPAEISDESRRRHAVESAPPPVGRRVTALVAFVSLVASVVIAMVTVPKGIDQGPEVSSSTTGVAAPTKGGASGSVAQARANPAVAVAPHIVVSTQPPSAGGTVTLTDGTSVTATPLLAGEEHGITIMRTDEDVTPVINELSDDEFRYLGDEGRLSLVLADGTKETTRLGVSTRDPGRWWPLSIQTPAHSSIARIVDEDDALVGIAVRENHGTWALTIADLLAMVNDGDARGG